MNNNINKGDVLGLVISVMIVSAIVIYLILLPKSSEKYLCFEGSYIGRFPGDNYFVVVKNNDTSKLNIKIIYEYKQYIDSISSVVYNPYLRIWYNHIEMTTHRGSSHHNKLIQLECDGKILKEYDWVSDNFLVKIFVPIGLFFIYVIFFCIKTIKRQCNKT